MSSGTTGSNKIYTYPVYDPMMNYAEQYTDITPVNRVITDKPITINTYKYGIDISSSELCDVLHCFMRQHCNEGCSLDYFAEKIFINNKVTIELKPDRDEILFSFV